MKIDDDAWEKAKRYLPNFYPGCDLKLASNMTLNAIARAIMDQKALCIQICEEEYETRMDSDYPAERIHDFVVVARSIQRKVRGDKIGR